MVGIPEELVNRMNSGEVTGFQLLPEGYYLAKIVSAEEQPARDSNSHPYVRTRWVIVEPEEHDKEDVLLNLSFAPKAAFRLMQVYDALGYSYDSDFEEMIEEEELAVLYIVQEVSGGGKSRGKLVNSVDEVLEPTPGNRDLIKVSE